VRTLSKTDLLGQRSDRVALKDNKHVYRACSMEFAQCLGFDSPDEVIGKTDFDLFPDETARVQLSLDNQTVYSAQADISAIALGTSNSHAMIVRTPVFGVDGRVNGIDLRLIGGPNVTPVKSAVTIDFQTLVNDGIQGSLIFSRNDILFANENAAQVFGFANAQTLSDQGDISELFSAAVLAQFTTASIDELEQSDTSQTQRITVAALTRDGKPLRLVARARHVQWGTARAILLSFIDISNTATKTIGVAASTFNPENAPRDVQLLRATAQRFRHFAKASADFFWELDASLKFCLVTDDLAAVLGIDRELIVGHTHQQIIEHPSNDNEHDHWQAHLALLKDNLAFRDFEFRWTVNGETKVIRYSGIPVHNRNGE